ncbi:MAG: ImmA/IrrE family metallo-endopeptidase [Chloroflexi bacterium]|nr:ImmA/IrrE family metallo-endopeptidase [Chloroflexota bacterium]
MALSIEEVAARLGVKPFEVKQWESNAQEPSIEVLWQLAEIYGRGTDYFLKETRPFPQDVAFRLSKHEQLGQLSLESRKTLVTFQELCRAEAELETLLGSPRDVNVNRLQNGRDAESLADSERKRLGLGEEPIPNKAKDRDLRTLLTQQGVRIFELPVKEGEFAGFSLWHPQYGPCMLVNAKDIPGRRAFTMAHEYAHFILSATPSLCDLNDNQSEERFANEFAASFLIPASDVREEFRKRGLIGKLPTEAELIPLRTRYGVSLEALARSLERLRLVPSGFTDRNKDLWQVTPRFRPSRTPLWKRRLGKKYVDLALRNYYQGHISVGKLAEYLGIDIRKAVAEAEGAKRPSSSNGGR